MTAKDYIIQLLDALQDEWPIAKGLKVLVERGNVDDATINALADIFAKVIESLGDESKKEAFRKGLTILNKIKQKENEHREFEDKEITNLEELIQDL